MAVAQRPVVAVVGRPNVGKSTLVNRIVGRRVAIVEEHPGVTRDRLELVVEWDGEEMILVDTGGVLERGDELDDKVTEQAIRAAKSADLVLFVLDTTTGVTAEDEAVAKILRRAGRPVIVVANKVDSATREAEAWAFSRFGLGDPVAVSALHGRGTGDLLDDVVVRVRSARSAARARDSSAGDPATATGAGSLASEVDARDPAERDSTMSPVSGWEGVPTLSSPLEVAAAVAIVGRPNVGKSTLFNKIVGDERSVVHDLPGTTRDAIDTVVMTSEGLLRFVDTAGMRRRAKIGEGAEYYSFVRALAAVDRADIALLVLDATEGVTHQEQRLAERIDLSGSPVVIVANKWELCETTQRLEVAREIEDRLGFLAYAPVLRVSALTGLGVHRLLPALSAALAAYHRRIPTGQLNAAIRETQAAHPAPGARILYAVQGAVDPPTMTLFTSGRLPPTYLRYVEHSLRARFGLGPSPLKLRVRIRGKS